MSETSHGGAAERDLQHTTEELDHDLERLGDHIEEAQKKLQERREEANPAETVAGDWEETRGAPGQGEDPEGAAPDRDAEGATTADADPETDARGMSAAQADAAAEELHED
jgi:hypothetical protein